MKKENAATSATHIGTQPGRKPGEYAPNGLECLNSACRARRVDHVIHAPVHKIDFPEALGFGTINRWQVEVRQPCCASADRAVILGANVDALFAYGPAEKWEEIGREKGGSVRESDKRSLPDKGRARWARLVNFQPPCSASGRHREIQTRGRASDPRGRYPIAWRNFQSSITNQNLLLRIGSRIANWGAAVAHAPNDIVIFELLE